jgi:hypothetical protein
LTTRSAVSSGPKAFNASRGRDLRISGNQRKVKCDGGRSDQAVTAFRNRIEPLGNVDNFGCQFRFMVHGMTIVTRNVADFEATGAPVINPWE